VSWPAEADVDGTAPGEPPRWGETAATPPRPIVTGAPATVRSRSSSGTVDVSGTVGVPELSGASPLVDASTTLGAPDDVGALRRALTACCQQLRQRTGADRTTVRLDLESIGADVDQALGEAVADGVPSLGDDLAIEQRRLPTIQWLEATRRPLVQGTPDDPPGIPLVLCHAYGVRSQLLGPLEHAGTLSGWISVHRGREGRWTAHDLLAVAAAAGQVARLVGWDAPAWVRHVHVVGGTDPGAADGTARR